MMSNNIAPRFSNDVARAGVAWRMWPELKRRRHSEGERTHAWLSVTGPLVTFLLRAARNQHQRQPLYGDTHHPNPAFLFPDRYAHTPSFLSKNSLSQSPLPCRSHERH